MCLKCTMALLRLPRRSLCSLLAMTTIFWIPNQVGNDRDNVGNDRDNVGNDRNVLPSRTSGNIILFVVSVTSWVIVFNPWLSP